MNISKQIMKGPYNQSFRNFLEEIFETANFFVATTSGISTEDRTQAVRVMLAYAFQRGIQAAEERNAGEKK